MIINNQHEKHEEKIKYNTKYFDFDVKKKSVKQLHFSDLLSRRLMKTISKLQELRKMKFTIQRFQNQFQQEQSIFKRFRYARDKYRFIVETLFEQITYLQSQFDNASTKKEKMYDSNNEKKKNRFFAPPHQKFSTIQYYDKFARPEMHAFLI